MVFLVQLFDRITIENLKLITSFYKILPKGSLFCIYFAMYVSNQVVQVVQVQVAKKL